MKKRPEPHSDVVGAGVRELMAGDREDAPLGGWAGETTGLHAPPAVLMRASAGTR